MFTTKSSIKGSHLLRLIETYVDGVALAPDLTQEIMVVFDATTWCRIFWSPASERWYVSWHSDVGGAGGGWSEPIELATEDLRVSIREYELSINNAKGLQHKTPSRVSLFFCHA